MARTPEQCLEQLYHGNSSCAHRNPVRNARCSLSQVLCVEKGKKRTFFCLNFYSDEQESIQSNIFCFASRDGDRQIDKWCLLCRPAEDTWWEKSRASAAEEAEEAAAADDIPSSSSHDHSQVCSCSSRFFLSSSDDDDDGNSALCNSSKSGRRMWFCFWGFS